MNQVNLRHWQSAHTDRLRALDFYRNELTILQDRLNNIAGRNTGSDIMKQVEHFGNQFLVHNEKIDELQHDIRENIHGISQDAASHNGFAPADLLKTATDQQHAFDTEEKLVNELRQEFNRFCADYM